MVQDFRQILRNVDVDSLTFSLMSLFSDVETQFTDNIEQHLAVQSKQECNVWSEQNIKISRFFQDVH